MYTLAEASHLSYNMPEKRNGNTRKKKCGIAATRGLYMIEPKTEHYKRKQEVEGRNRGKGKVRRNKKLKKEKTLLLNQIILTHTHLYLLGET